MEQTLPPLVSEYDTQNLWDDVVRPVVKAMEKQLGQCSPAFQAGEMARAIIPIYEADRAKTREVVQILFDALCDSRPNHHEDAHALYNNAMDAALAAGLKPSEQP